MITAEKLQAFRVSGYVPAWNNTEVQINDRGDKARYRMAGKVSPWQAIKYTKKSRAYINIKGVRVHLDEVLRADRWF